MNTEQFTASSKYEDLKGTVAADHADAQSVSAWLEQQNLIAGEEYVVGIRLHVGQLSNSDDFLIQTEFLIALNETDLRVRIPGQDKPPTIVVRRLQKELTLNDFFRFFKQLELTLSAGGEFEGRDYSYVG